MSRPRMSQDEAFWRIVKDLNWKLDDGRAGPPPPGDPEFSHGGKGSPMLPSLPVWATHLIVFVLGGLSLAVLLVQPLLLPAIALWTVGVAGAVTFLRRRA